MKNLILLFFCLSSTLTHAARTLRIPETDPDRDRAKVVLPDNFESREKWPLVVSIHGYGGTHLLQNIFMRFGRWTTDYGFILLTPNGRKDNRMLQFWNASNFCCDFQQTGVDDVQYIKDLIERVKSHPEVGRIDDRKIYLVGHSNGAFLSNKIACEWNEGIAGIATFAGTADLFDNEGNDVTNIFGMCEHSNPMKILHLHGTSDPTIDFVGGVKSYRSDDMKVGILGAHNFVRKWSEQNNCKSKLPKPVGELNLVSTVSGDETLHYRYEGCDEKTEFFQMLGANHVPKFKKRAIKKILEFFLK